jgi:hypothetical protein
MVMGAESWIVGTGTVGVELDDVGVESIVDGGILGISLFTPSRREESIGVVLDPEGRS